MTIQRKQIEKKQTYSMVDKIYCDVCGEECRKETALHGDDRFTAPMLIEYNERNREDNEVYQRAYGFGEEASGWVNAWYPTKSLQLCEKHAKAVLDYIERI